MGGGGLGGLPLPSGKGGLIVLAIVVVVSLLGGRRSQPTPVSAT